MCVYRDIHVVFHFVCVCVLSLPENAIFYYLDELDIKDKKFKDFVVKMLKKMTFL